MFDAMRFVLLWLQSYFLLQNYAMINRKHAHFFILFCYKHLFFYFQPSFLLTIIWSYGRNSVTLSRLYYYNDLNSF